MSRPSKLSGLLFAGMWVVLVCGAAHGAKPNAAVDRAEGASRVDGVGCPDDSDCDGISNAIEAAVGGAGIDPAPGTAVASAVQNPAGIQIALASPGLSSTASVSLPPGTTAGAEPITLEFGVDPYFSGSGAFVVVRKAQLSGGTKSITVPISAHSVVALADSPEATSASLKSVPRSSRFQVPPCPCPSSTSTNLEGGMTAYTITNTGSSITVTNLSYSAVGLTNTAAPVPAMSTWSAMLMALSVTVLGAMMLWRRRAGAARA